MSRSIHSRDDVGESIMNLPYPSTRVCMMTSAHSAFDTRIFHKECKSLAEAGYEVILIVPHEHDEIVDDVQIKAVLKPANRFIRVSGTVRQIYHEAVRLNADIYHFHDPDLIPIGLLLHAMGKNVIYDIHEYYKEKILSKHYIPKFLRKVVATVFGLFESFAAWFFDGIIVADETTGRKYHGKAVCVANFPYLPKNFNSTTQIFDTFTIVYAGTRITEDRGLLKMIEAMEFVHEPAKLVLVGKIVPQAVKEKMQALPGYKKVCYLGMKPWPEAMGIIASCHLGLVLLQPIPAYLYAGENTVKIFEYMMFGLPVIASNFPNLSRIVENTSCGISVDPTNPKSIAEKINYLMENRNVLDEMGKNGKKVVKEKYNWKFASKNLLNLYESILAG